MTIHFNQFRGDGNPIKDVMFDEGNAKILKTYWLFQAMIMFQKSNKQLNYMPYTSFAHVNDKLTCHDVIDYLTEIHKGYEIHQALVQWHTALWFIFVGGHGPPP